jgi:phosphatidylglycerophosphatase A
MKLLNKFISTFVFTGYLPKAPGTWGSLFALLLWWFVVPENDKLLQIMLIVTVIIMGLLSSDWFSKNEGRKDPSEVVIDEVAGMWITLFMIPHQWHYFLIGFILFRFFDITKPGIIDRSQKLPNGWGIMVDDIISGIFSWLVLRGLLFII